MSRGRTAPPEATAAPGRLRWILLGVVVALKLLRHELVASPKAVADFQKEAALAMTLRHPNIVPVLDYDEVGGDYFIVMDNLEGQRLDAVLQEGKPLAL